MSEMSPLLWPDRARLLEDAPDEMTGKVIEFVYNTPGSDEDIKANIRHALSLGLPHAADLSRKRLQVMANGPSARHAPLTLDDTMVINGALSICERAPTYFVGCDPQKLLTSFLIDPPLQTQYLIASKCHPAVFDALWDRDVRLWHVSDQEEYLATLGKFRQIPCAVSATLCGLQLAQRLGYREIDVWGWDCCFMDGLHHAGLGSVAPEEPLTVAVGPDAVQFETKRNWAAEAQDASKVLPVLRWTGCDIRIHGGGMVGAINPEFAPPEETLLCLAG